MCMLCLDEPVLLMCVLWMSVYFPARQDSAMQHGRIAVPKDLPSKNLLVQYSQKRGHSSQMSNFLSAEAQPGMRHGSRCLAASGSWGHFASCHSHSCFSRAQGAASCISISTDDLGIWGVVLKFLASVQLLLSLRQDSPISPL
jgi:hypothetical protein